MGRGTRVPRAGGTTARRATRRHTGAVAALVTVVLATVAGLLPGVVATAGAAGAAGRSAAARTAPVLRAAPVFRRRAFADPSVAAYRGGFLAAATGPYVRRAVSRSPAGPWRPGGRALVRMPRWARSASVWAPDLARGRHGWLLYYAAVAHRPDRRCIGVAAARTPLDRFRPVGRHPLACPPRGAIDPSSFTDGHGRRYLLFKTQGLPATIQVLRLARDGRHRARVGRGHHGRRHRGNHRSRPARPLTVLTSNHIVENPVAVRRGRGLVLLTSENFYGSCAYRTTWRRARHFAGWRRARPHDLLDFRRTRICGPGGADVVRGRRGSLIFFHGWRCGHGVRPCAERPGARRKLFAAHLGWRQGAPRVRGYLRRR